MDLGDQAADDNPEHLFPDLGAGAIEAVCLQIGVESGGEREIGTMAEVVRSLFTSSPR